MLGFETRQETVPSQRLHHHQPPLRPRSVSRLPEEEEGEEEAIRVMMARGSSSDQFGSAADEGLPGDSFPETGRLGLWRVWFLAIMAASAFPETK